jgi:hypothetical protein
VALLRERTREVRKLAREVLMQEQDAHRPTGRPPRDGG